MLHLKHDLYMTVSLHLLPLTLIHVLTLACSYDFKLGLKHGLGLGVTGVATASYTSHVLDVACDILLASPPPSETRAF